MVNYVGPTDGVKQPGKTAKGVSQIGSHTLGPGFNKLVAAGLQPHAPQNLMAIPMHPGEVAAWEAITRSPPEQAEYLSLVLAQAHDNLLTGNRGRAPDGRPS